MTCKDCIYLNSSKSYVDSHGIRYYECKAETDVNGEYRMIDIEPICGLFEDKEGTFHNGTEHCPRCGRVVGKWGLCMDCEILYGGCKQEVFDEYGNYKYPSDIILDKPNNATSCVENALGALNSWESVSK